MNAEPRSLGMTPRQAGAAYYYATFRAAAPPTRHLRLQTVAGSLHRPRSEAPNGARVRAEHAWHVLRIAAATVAGAGKGASIPVRERRLPGAEKVTSEARIAEHAVRPLRLTRYG